MGNNASRKTRVLIISVLAVLLTVLLSCFFVSRYTDKKQIDYQAEMLNELDMKIGTYDQQSIVLQNTSFESASIRAEHDPKYSTVNPSGSTLSDGSLTIIVGVACSVVFGVLGFVLGAKKKKNAEEK